MNLFKSAPATKPIAAALPQNLEPINTSSTLKELPLPPEAINFHHLYPSWPSVWISSSSQNGETLDTSNGSNKKNLPPPRTLNMKEMHQMHERFPELPPNLSPGALLAIAKKHALLPETLPVANENNVESVVGPPQQANMLACRELATFFPELTLSLLGVDKCVPRQVNCSFKNEKEDILSKFLKETHVAVPTNLVTSRKYSVPMNDQTDASNFVHTSNAPTIFKSRVFEISASRPFPLHLESNFPKDPNQSSASDKPLPLIMPSVPVRSGNVGQSVMNNGKKISLLIDTKRRCDDMQLVESAKAQGKGFMDFTEQKVKSWLEEPKQKSKLSKTSGARKPRAANPSQDHIKRRSISKKASSSSLSHSAATQIARISQAEIATALRTHSKSLEMLPREQSSNVLEPENITYITTENVLPNNTEVPSVQEYATDGAKANVSATNPVSTDAVNIEKSSYSTHSLSLEDESNIDQILTNTALIIGDYQMPVLTSSASVVKEAEVHENAHAVDNNSTDIQPMLNEHMVAGQGCDTEIQSNVSELHEENVHSEKDDTLEAQQAIKNDNVAPAEPTAVASDNEIQATSKISVSSLGNAENETVIVCSEPVFDKDDLPPLPPKDAKSESPLPSEQNDNELAIKKSLISGIENVKERITSITTRPSSAPKDILESPNIAQESPKTATSKKSIFSNAFDSYNKLFNGKNKSSLQKSNTSITSSESKVKPLESQSQLPRLEAAAIEAPTETHSADTAPKAVVGTVFLTTAEPSIVEKASSLSIILKSSEQDIQLSINSKRGSISESLSEQSLKTEPLDADNQAVTVNNNEEVPQFQKATLTKSNSEHDSVVLSIEKNDVPVTVETSNSSSSLAVQDQITTAPVQIQNETLEIFSDEFDRKRDAKELLPASSGNIHQLNSDDIDESQKGSSSAIKMPQQLWNSSDFLSNNNFEAPVAIEEKPGNFDTSKLYDTAEKLEQGTLAVAEIGNAPNSVTDGQRNATTDFKPAAQITIVPIEQPQAIALQDANLKVVENSKSLESSSPSPMNTTSNEAKIGAVKGDTPKIGNTRKFMFGNALDKFNKNLNKGTAINSITSLEQNESISIAEADSRSLLLNPQSAKQATPFLYSSNESQISSTVSTSENVLESSRNSTEGIHVPEQLSAAVNPSLPVKAADQDGDGLIIDLFAPSKPIESENSSPILLNDVPEGPAAAEINLEVNPDDSLNTAFKKANYDSVEVASADLSAEAPIKSSVVENNDSASDASSIESHSTTDELPVVHERPDPVSSPTNQDSKDDITPKEEAQSHKIEAEASNLLETSSQPIALKLEDSIPEPVVTTQPESAKQKVSEHKPEEEEKPVSSNDGPETAKPLLLENNSKEERIRKPFIPKGAFSLIPGKQNADTIRSAKVSLKAIPNETESFSAIPAAEPSDNKKNLDSSEGNTTHIREDTGKFSKASSSSAKRGSLATSRDGLSAKPVFHVSFSPNIEVESSESEAESETAKEEPIKVQEPEQSPEISRQEDPEENENLLILQREIADAKEELSRRVMGEDGDFCSIKVAQNELHCTIIGKEKQIKPFPLSLYRILEAKCVGSQAVIYATVEREKKQGGGGKLTEIRLGFPSVHDADVWCDNLNLVVYQGRQGEVQNNKVTLLVLPNSTKPAAKEMIEKHMLKLASSISKPMKLINIPDTLNKDAVRAILLGIDWRNTNSIGWILPDTVADPALAHQARTFVANLKSWIEEIIQSKPEFKASAAGRSQHLYSIEGDITPVDPAEAALALSKKPLDYKVFICLMYLHREKGKLGRVFKAFF